VAQSINVNGVSINYPETGDTNWSDDATNFAVQTSSALGKIGLSSGTNVDVAGILDVTGATTLDSTLTVAGTTTLNGTANLNGNTNLGNATSDTTAVTGILNVDSGVLYVDPTNNRVGVNKTNPAQALDVTGNALISGTLGVTGNSTFTGDVIASIVKASGSGGLTIDSNGGTDVALFGAGGGSGTTLYGGLNGTTGNFTDATDATNADTAPLKTLGGMAVKKKLFVGTDANIGGDANVTGKIITGNGTVSLPSHSFTSDPDTGFYRISDGVMGFTSNGIKKGEFGADYGGFVGNVIQWINDKTQTTKTNAGNTYLDIEKGAGVSWEIPITPKLSGSKIVIIFRGAFQISAASGVMGVRVLQKLNVGGSYTVIWRPEEANTTSPFAPVDVGSGATSAMYKNDYFIQVYVNPSYVIGNTLYFKFQFAANTTNSITNNVSRTGNNGETSVSIMEIAQ
jgi:hypothetical protein